MLYTERKIKQLKLMFLLYIKYTMEKIKEKIHTKVIKK